MGQMLWIRLMVALLATCALEGWAWTAPGGDLVAQRGGRRAPGRGGPPAAPMAIRSLVQGRVASVDPTSGSVVLALDGASVEARFAPAIVAGVRPGDDVFVTVELIDPRRAVVRGAVTAVDPPRGAVTVATPRGPWTVTFSSGAVSDIEPGGEVLLKLDLVDVGPRLDGPTPR